MWCSLSNSPEGNGNRQAWLISMPCRGQYCLLPLDEVLWKNFKCLHVSVLWSSDHYTCCGNELETCKLLRRGLFCCIEKKICHFHGNDFTFVLNPHKLHGVKYKTSCFLICLVWNLEKRHPYHCTSSKGVCPLLQLRLKTVLTSATRKHRGKGCWLLALHI